MNRPASSASLSAPTFWWYRVRERLLETVFRDHIRAGSRLADIGSADGPSVRWLATCTDRIPVDVNPEGLGAGGVCASAVQLPFSDGSFEVVSAFDVIEHVEDERDILRELHRVLEPGGRLLVSVPAYRWAWSSHDVASGHYRRYTAKRLIRALEGAGFQVDRATYAFAATFPLFAFDRITDRLSGRSAQRPGAGCIPPWLERILFALGRIDDRVLRRSDLPFGSSVLAAATRR